MYPTCGTCIRATDQRSPLIKTRRRGHELSKNSSLIYVEQRSFWNCVMHIYKPCGPKIFRFRDVLAVRIFLCPAPQYGKLASEMSVHMLRPLTSSFTELKHRYRVPKRVETLLWHLIIPDRFNYRSIIKTQKSLALQKSQFPYVLRHTPLILKHFPRN
jgi:hypothetical protein